MFRVMPKRGPSSWKVISTDLLTSLAGLQTQLELCLYKLKGSERTQLPSLSLPFSFHYTVDTTELDKNQNKIWKQVLFPIIICFMAWLL